jgi:inner membrane transporter RhtA
VRAVAAALGRIPVPLWPLCAMISVQLGSALTVPMIERVGAATTTSLRLAWAALFLLAVAPPRLGAGSGPRLVGGACLGLVTAGMTLCYFEAAARIPLGMVTSIEFLGPLAVAIGGSRNSRDLLWAALAAGGVALLTRGGEAGGASLSGYAFAGGAAICWGCYILLTRRVGATFSGLQGLTVSICVAALAMAPPVLATHWRSIDLGLLAAMAGVAILSPFLPFALEMATLRRMRPRPFGIMMSLEPATSAAMGFIVLGQRLGPLPLAGMACVMLASVGAVAGKSEAG